MLPNDDLARWGEPPTDDSELALAELLADVLDCRLDQQAVSERTTSRIEETTSARSLLQVSTWMDELIGLILERSGLVDHLPPPADAGGQAGVLAVELRLAVRRVLPGGRFQAVASTHVRPCVVRDLRRVPDDPDRVTLRTRDRVRIEVSCDRPGYLLVLNVGPGGNLNLLYPERPLETGAIRPGEPLLIADVEMMPPAGRELVYAVWSRVPVTVQQLAGLVGRGATLRDMKRVQDELASARPEEWHAVMLELEHQG